MPDTTNSPTTGVQPATQPATGVQPVSGVQPGVPFQDLTKWATKAPEGETLISTAYRDKVTDDLKFVENKPGVHKPDPILVADNVTRKFGGMTAVDVSHFEIERHGITALIGPNGAGKTTFFNLMTGFDTPNTGTWQFDGKDMAHVQPEKVARMGMVRTFQLTKVIPIDLAVEEMKQGNYNSYFKKAGQKIVHLNDQAVDLGVSAAVKVAWSEAEVTEFKNVYAADPVESSVTDQITVAKSLTGRDLTEGEFSFELREVKGEDSELIETVANAADGKVTFSTIKYTEIGQHTYMLREVKGHAGGRTYADTI